MFKAIGFGPSCLVNNTRIHTNNTRISNNCIYCLKLGQVPTYHKN